MPATAAKAVVLAKPPIKGSKLSEDLFEVVDVELPPLGEGELLIRTIYASVDPYMHQYSLHDPSQTGAVVRSRAIGIVMESKHSDYAEGTAVYGSFGWCTHSIEKPSGAATVYMADGTTREVAGSDGFRALVVNKAVPPAAAGLSALPRYLGVLGMPGLAAYAGIARLINVKRGSTIVVSSAAGAVGLVAAQVAKAMGAARVVGATGSDEKVAFLQSCGIQAFNYRSKETGKRLEGEAAYTHYCALLAEHCPDGIDGYFDNVGGQFLDAVLLHGNEFCRVAVCGIISTLDKTESGEEGGWPCRNLTRVLPKQMRIEGFQARQHYDLFSEYTEKMSTWLITGEVQYQESLLEGLPALPKALLGMLAGGNVGKQLVQLSADPFVP